MGSDGGGKAYYHVEGSEIVGTSTLKTPNSFRCTERDSSDFILDHEFKIDPGLNSGVQLRSECLDRPTEFNWRGETIAIAAGRGHGYRIEIDPSSRAWIAGIFDEARRKWMYPGFAGGDAAAFTSAAAKVFKPNEWNPIRVEARGNSVKIWLNGVPRADIVDDVTPRDSIAFQPTPSSTTPVKTAPRRADATSSSPSSILPRDRTSPVHPRSLPGLLARLRSRAALRPAKRPARGA